MWKRNAVAMLVAALIGVGGSIYFTARILEKRSNVTLSTELVDFGDVAPGSLASKDVLIRNVGSETLHIGNVNTSCSCIHASVQDGVLHSSEETRLTIQLTGGEAESFGGHVHVHTDDRECPVKVVAVISRNHVTAALSPNLLQFSPSESGEKSLEAYAWLPHGDILRDGNIITAVPDSSLLKVSVVEDPGARRAVITVEVPHDKGPITGEFRSAVLVRDRHGYLDARIRVQCARRSRFFRLFSRIRG